MVTIYTPVNALWRRVNEKQDHYNREYSNHTVTGIQSAPYLW